MYPMRRLAWVAMLAVAVGIAQGQEFRNVESLLERVDSTLRSTAVQSPRTWSQSLRDTTEVGNASLNGRLSALEEKVLMLQRTQRPAVDTGSIAAAIADLRKAIDAVKAPVAPKFPAMKVGILGQFHAMATQDQSTAAQDNDPAYTRHWQRQTYMRRMRVLVGASLSAQTSFFFESDAVNIGKVAANGAKTNGVAMYVQDAQIQHVFMPEFSVIAGLQLVGIARNGLQSAATLMALNYGSFQFVPTGPLDNSVGRDLGVNFRGFVADERLEYRVGVFSGRSFNLFSPLRVAGRLQYNFFEKEKGFYYGGTYLGAARYLSLGAGVDVQGTYRGYAADLFGELPLDDTHWLTLSGSVSFLDGGGSDMDSTYFTGAIPRQTVLFLEAGVLFKAVNLQPYLKIESQEVNAKVLRQVGATEATLDLQNGLRSNDRIGFGLNYFVTGHQANVKLLYEIVGRKRLTLDKSAYEHVSNGECTLQVQFFMY
jgi:hypothetical protein